MLLLHVGNLMPVIKPRLVGVMDVERRVAVNGFHNAFVVGKVRVSWSGMSG